MRSPLFILYRALFAYILNRACWTDGLLSGSETALVSVPCQNKRILFVFFFGIFFILCFAETVSACMQPGLFCTATYLVSARLVGIPSLLLHDLRLHLPCIMWVVIPPRTSKEGPVPWRNTDRLQNTGLFAPLPIWCRPLVVPVPPVGRSCAYPMPMVMCLANIFLMYLGVWYSTD